MSISCDICRMMRFQYAGQLGLSERVPIHKGWNLYGGGFPNVSVVLFMLLYFLKCNVIVFCLGGIFLCMLQKLSVNCWEYNIQYTGTTLSSLPSSPPWILLRDSFSSSCPLYSPTLSNPWAFRFHFSRGYLPWQGPTTQEIIIRFHRAST